tara:strand:- start:168 stop:308 length:141 start_codon:yes stop_codon:yes gene_type:complete
LSDPSNETNGGRSNGQDGKKFGTQRCVGEKEKKECDFSEDGEEGKD